MGQRPFPPCFEKTHLTSDIFISLSNAWPEMLWTGTKQNSTAWYCARSNLKLLHSPDSPSALLRFWVFIWKAALSDWCLSSAAALTRGSHQVLKQATVQLLNYLSLRSFKKNPLRFNLKQTQLIPFYGRELNQREVTDSKLLFWWQCHHS